MKPLRGNLLITLLFILGATCILQGQYRVKQYTVQDGLSHNHVYQSFQDNRGFVWAVTLDALVFFDGVDFTKVLEWAPLKSTKAVVILFEDNNGKLWVQRSDLGGVVFLQIDIHTREVEPISFYKGDRLLPIRTIALGTDQTLYLGDDQGVLWKRSPKGEVEEYYRCPLGQFEFCSATNNGTTLWIRLDRYNGLGSIVFSIDVYRRVYEYYIPESDGVVLPSVGGGCWAICANQYAKLEHGRPPVFRASKAVERIKGTRIRREIFVLEPGKDEFWIFNEGDPLLVDAVQDRVVAKMTLPTQDKIEGAFHLMIDRQHRFWVSTLHGLFRVDQFSSRFKKIGAIEKPMTFFRPSRGMVEGAKGQLYFNLGDTTYRYSPADDRLIPLTSQQLGYYDLKIDLDGSLIMALSELRIFNLKTGQAKNYESLDLRSTIWGILPTETRIWLGHAEGLLYFDRLDQSIKPFLQYNGFDALRRSEVYYMVESGKEGLIHLFTSTGIYALHPERGILARYWSGGEGRYYLPADNIRHGCLDGMGGYWLASSEGLIHWNWVLMEIKLFTSQDGLPNNNIYAVYLDNYGFVWATSDHGLVQLQPHSGKLRFFTEEDGLAHNEFNRLAHLKATDGTFYFGGLNGINRFNPSDFSSDFEEDLAVGLFLTNISVLGSSTSSSRDLLSLFYNNGSIELLPGEQLLQLKVAVPPVLLSNSTTYYYRLKGVNTTYLKSKSGEIKLWGLSPGSYELEIYAKTANGQILRMDTSIPICVHPPFYTRTGFKLAILLLVVGISSYLWKRRVHFLKKKQVELEEEVAKRTAKITADKKLIEQQATRLKHQDIEKTRFITNLMHELRTPLSLVLGPLERYRKQYTHRPEEDNLLQIAVNNANRMLELVNDALSLQLIADGRSISQEEPADLERFVRGVSSEFMVLAKKKGLYLRVESAVNRELLFHCDCKSFRGVLNNLLSNALKFTSTGGITVRLVEFEAHVQVSVSDTGRGIHPDDVPHIFERYYQTQRQDAPAEGGVGIGLALSRELVQLMGGTIWVESNWGKGSTFYVEFPKKIAGSLEYAQRGLEQVSSEPTNPIIPKALDGKKASILLVEDNLEFQEYYKVLLRPYYHLAVVNQGLEALEWMANHTVPDLLLVDIMMPELDGLQLVQLLKSNEHFQSIPIIVVSAKTGQSERLKALQLGVVDYLEKPFTEAQLIARIQAVLTSMQAAVGASSEISIKDLEWLQRLEDLVYAHLGDTGFSVDWCASQMLMARSAFFKEVRRLTAMTPNQYIQEARLEKARRLLESGGYDSLRRLVNDLGVADERYFSKLFKQRFGQSIRSYFEA